MMYQIVTEQGQKTKKPLTGDGYGLPLGTWIGYEGACPDGFLEAGTTFDTTTYAALYAMLGSNKVPERFDHSKLSDPELIDGTSESGFNLTTTNSICPYDGFITFGHRQSHTSLYVNDVLVSESCSEGSGATSIYAVRKGDLVRSNAAATSSFYFNARWYKKHLAIKATPAYVEPDTVSDMMAVINRNNTYSTEETLTGKTWIDGKPIYRKCFELTSPSNGTVLVSGASEFTDMGGWFKDSANDDLVPFPHTITSGTRHLRLNEGNHEIYLSTQATIYKCKIWVEYTKTTD